MYGVLVVLAVLLALALAGWRWTRARRVAPVEPAAPLNLRPLSEPVRKSFMQEWRVVQQRFADQPSVALGSANSLLAQVMTERGYPVADFDERAESISVEHPDVVRNYRIARKIHRSNREQRATVDQLRTALASYRLLFDELLTTGRAVRNRTSDSASARTEDSARNT